MEDKYNGMTWEEANAERLAAEAQLDALVAQYEAAAWQLLAAVAVIVAMALIGVLWLVTQS